MATATHTFSAIPRGFQLSDRLAGDYSQAPQWQKETNAREPSAIMGATAYKQLRDGIAVVMTELRRDVKTVTSERQYLDTSKLSGDWLTKISKVTQSARDGLNNRIAELGDEITAKMRCNDNIYTDKLRDRLYAMKPADRNTFAEQAIEAGDRSQMAAFFNGDAILSGFTEAQQKAFRNVALNKHAGDLIEKRQNLKYAHDIIFDAFNDTLAALGTLFPKERVRQLQNEVDEIKTARNSLIN